MNKYLAIFTISFQHEFAYKLNFIMWRVRNMMQIVVFYFLWSAAFTNTDNVLGYSKDRILTYALLLIIIRAISLSSRSVDVAGQIANGDLTNFLTKPINFFSFWLIRDISSKFLNISFAICEIFILFIFLRPPFLFQTDIFYLVFFVISLLIAIFLFFNILMLTNFVPFWFPEVAWGAQFLVVVIVIEFLSGAVFPIDVFPKALYQLILLTPFPHLIFVPIQIFLGSFSLNSVLIYTSVGLLWCFILWKLTNIVWKRGLKIYEAVGR